MYFYKYCDRYVKKFEAKSTKNMDCIYTLTKNYMQKIGQLLDQSRLNYINPFLYEETEKSMNNEQALIDGNIYFFTLPHQ